MAKVVEIQYNPYIPQLRILINGIPPSDFSRLVQYADEDIWYWHDRILDTLYEEVADDFSLLFTGTDVDTAIMRLLCERSQHCLGFVAKKFAIADSLQSRIQRLNQLIKRNTNIRYQKTEIRSVFYISSPRSGLYDLIQMFNIRNLFCSVNISFGKTYSESDKKREDVLFFIVNDMAEAESKLALQTTCPVFVILTGLRSRLRKAEGMARLWETTEAEMQETIFSCLLQGPLLWAFRNCLKSISKTKEGEDELPGLINVDSVIHIRMKEEIEVGKSIRIEPISEQEEIPLPRLTYRIQEKDIAFTDGLCVFGKREGNATLEIYRYGEKVPFILKKIKVIRRNRIREIILSEDTLLLGMGDRRKLNCSCFPEDADNADTVSWMSSDESIIRVDQNGNLTAVGCGNCQVMCIAENISAKCVCQVKPYLQEIRIATPLENGRLYLAPFEERKLQLCCVPEDCKDGDLKITSLNTDVVNIIGNILYAKDRGHTSLTIQNSSGSKKCILEVIVRAVQKEKKGILDLFLQKLRKG